MNTYQKFLATIGLTTFLFWAANMHYVIKYGSENVAGLQITGWFTVIWVGCLIGFFIFKD